MDTSDFLVPVGRSEIAVGSPLAFALYDADGNLLLNRGDVLATDRQLAVLWENGLFREAQPAGTSDFPARQTESRREGAPADGKPQEESLNFEAIKVALGDSLQLQPLLEGQFDRYNVRVIGVLKPKSVLVTAPMLDGKLIFVRDGQTYLVRAFSGLNVCAFRARVLKSQLQPYPYLHLSYPDSVQAMRLRKTMRAPAAIIVAVHDSEEGRQVGAGKLADISIGGARLLSGIDLGTRGQAFWLSFKVRLGEVEEYVKAPAIIRSITHEEDEQGKPVNAFGLQFGELAHAQRLILMNLVYQHLLKDNL